MVVIDYGLCNIDSIARALSECGATPEVTRDPRSVNRAERIVLPGVGSFPRAMRNLREYGLVEPIVGRLSSPQDVPFLGICLGMQLMAALGTEHEETQGLGLMPGKVSRLRAVSDDRIPHVGWNEVVWKGSVLWKGIPENADFYFVHSYHVEPDEEDWVAATTHYAGKFVSSVASPTRPIFGTQFHPEKSQKNGFRVLRNFLSV